MTGACFPGPMNAADAWREALPAGLLAGRFAGPALRSVAEATRDTIAGTPSSDDDVLDGIAQLVTEGPATAIPALHNAVAVTTLATPAQLWLTGRAAGLIWDFEVWQRCAEQMVTGARDDGPA